MSLWWIVPLTLVGGIVLGGIGFYLYFMWVWYRNSPFG